jgi:DNA-binding PadR family transcriptional regulator
MTTHPRGTGPPYEEWPDAEDTGPTLHLTHRAPSDVGQCSQFNSPVCDPLPIRAWRNPIRRIGDGPSQNFTRVANQLVRQAIPAIGTDGFTVLALLLSHERGWETSAAEIARQLGLGRNRQRVRAALDRLVADRRLIIREHRRHGGGRVRQEYILWADGRQFSDREVEQWSIPITVIGGRGSHKRPDQ